MTQTRKKDGPRNSPEDFSREGQTRLALLRLTKLADKMVEKGKTKEALEIQREINNLLGIGASAVGEWADAKRAYDGGDTNQPSHQADAELAIVRSHLAPLGLAGPEASVGEHARLAVQRIVELISANSGEKKT